MGIKFCSSSIFVKDIVLAREFYEHLIEQEVEFDHGECISFIGGFALWQTDHALKIIFDQTFNKEESHKARHSCELYFESDNLDEILDKMLEAKVEFVHPLHEQPWGQRVFRVYDMDKYIVEIGEPMKAVVKRFLGEGLNAEEVSKKTSLPLEFVNRLL
jgi:hypothetical protein